MTVHDLLVGSTLLASFLGCMVALFAPCCISVMLPAYFATGFRRRSALVSMTSVFALGVGTVILPIAFGASQLSRLISGHHTPVFLAGAAVMLAMGIATLLGWKLPMIAPAMRARTERGPAAVFALGAFSGVATACCAPVLAGVVTLSGAAGSFLVALAIGTAYVFGMVAPLFVIALAWDRFDWGNSALLRGRTFNIGLFGRRRAVHSTALVSGLLLVGMAALVGVLAIRGPSMPNRGWQVDLSARLQHYAAVVTRNVSFIPGWLWAGVLTLIVAWLAYKAIDQLSGPDADRQDNEDDDLTTPHVLPGTDPDQADGAPTDEHNPPSPQPDIDAERRNEVDPVH